MTSGLRTTHRVALEFEVIGDPEAAEPEDWDVQHLVRALEAGFAKPLRRIQGLVIDSERDRLSRTLAAVAEELDEAAQLHWLASAKPWPTIGWTLRPRPSLETLVELDRLCQTVRVVARRLEQEGQ